MAEPGSDAAAGLLLADPTLKALLQALAPLALPQWRLVAGCLYGTVWNALTGRPSGHGIRDWDLIYFDAGDLGEAAEAAVIARAEAATRGIVGTLEVRNQARVHLWYPRRFGRPYPPLASADAGLGRYLARVQALGVRLEEDGRLDLAAPFGLEDLFGLVFAPNTASAGGPERYAEKAAHVRRSWPEVTVLSWPQ